MRARSREARLAQLKGSLMMCPGCLIEKEVPENHNGAAFHRMPSGQPYECHADSEAWAGVPEFEEQGDGKHPQ